MPSLFHVLKLDELDSKKRGLAPALLFVPFQLFVNGFIDKAVDALAFVFCMGLDNFFFPFRHPYKHLVIGFIFIPLYTFIAVFAAQ